MSEARFLNHWNVRLPPGTKQMFGWKVEHPMRFESHTWRVVPEFENGAVLVEIVHPKVSRVKSASTKRIVSIGSDYAALEGDRLLSMPIWGVVPAAQFVPVPSGPTQTCQRGLELVVSFSNSGQSAIEVIYALLSIGLM